MSRIAIIITSMTLLAVLGAAGAAGWYIFVRPERQAAKILAMADVHYAEGNWDQARKRYAWYAAIKPERLDVLDKYIESNLRILRNRRDALANVGRAYIKISRQRPGDAAHRDMAISFLYGNHFWSELESLIEFYHGFYLKRKNDNPVHTTYYLAVAAERLGRITDAAEQYDALTARYEELVDAGQVPRDVYGGRARMLRQQGLEDNADRFLRTAPGAHKQDPQFDVQLAAYRLMTRELEAADAAMRRALGQSPPEAPGYGALLTAMREAFGQATFETTFAGYGVLLTAMHEALDSKTLGYGALLTAMREALGQTTFEASLEALGYDTLLTAMREVLEQVPLASYDTLLTAMREDLGQAKFEGTLEALGYDALLTASLLANARGDRAGALACAEQAIALGPSRPEAYTAAASVHNSLGNPDEAIALIKDADEFMLAAYPSLYHYLAELQFEQRDLEGAEASAEALRAVLPGGTILHNYLESRGMLLKREYEKAADKLSAVTNAAPDFSEAILYLTLAYLGLCNKEENTQEESGDYFRSAQGTLETYLEHRPGDEKARELYTSLFGGGIQAGRAQARILMAIKSIDPAIKIKEAKNLLDQHQHGESMGGVISVYIEQLLRGAMSEDPENPEPYNLLAQSLVVQDRGEEAGDVLEEGREAVGDEGGFELAEAAMALAKDGLNEALERRGAAFSASGFATNDALPWAYLFARQGHLEAGLATIDMAAAMAEAEAGAELLLEQMKLVLRYDALDRARELVTALTPRVKAYPALAGRLIEVRVALAGQLMMRDSTPGSDGAAAAAKMVDALEAEAPERAGVQLLRARLLAMEDPPRLDEARKLISGLGGNEHPLHIRVRCLTLLHDINNINGKYGKALENILAATDLFPDDLGLQLALGRAHMRVKEYREALAPLEKFYDYDPENSEVMELLVRVYGATRQLAQAEAMLDKFKTALGGDAETDESVAMLDAWLEARRGNIEQAEATLELRHKESPDNYEIFEELIRIIFFQRGQPDSAGLDRGEDAIQRAQKFANDHEGEKRAWTLLGNLRLQRELDNSVSRDFNAFLDASDAFSTAILVQEEFDPAIQGLIQTHLKLGDWGTANGLVDKLISLSLDDEENGTIRNPDFYYLKAVITANDSTRLRDAFGHVERAITLYEDQGGLPPWRYIALRGWLSLMLGDYESAVKDMRNLTQDRGIDNAAIYAHMAAAYLGMLEKAEAAGDAEATQGYFDEAKTYSTAARKIVLTDETRALESLDRIEARMSLFEARYGTDC